MTSEQYRKARKMAAKKVVSMLSEGYRLVSQSEGCDTVTLRHWSNENYMVVRVGHLGVYTFKNGKLVNLDLL